MQLEVFFTPHHVDELYLRGRKVVVIDVLRASTTIATALYNGAKEFIPVPTVEAAMKIVGDRSGEVTLLGGERNGNMIEGFHLGNSPLEYTEERVKGRSIVFTSTNGSQALAKARYAKEVLVCAFVNISAVVRELREARGDLTILCSGREGDFSMEDAVCAGMVLAKLLDTNTESITYGDAGAASLLLYKSQKRSLVGMLAKSEHGTYLKEIGYGNDVKFCAGIDTMPVVPALTGNVLKLKSSEPITVPA
ncbi:MAG: 2-phosphosulfolactate phosphatase [Ignavibacteria bacterium]